MSIKTCNCGRNTLSASGICVICQMDRKRPSVEEVSTSQEGNETKTKEGVNVAKKNCTVEGCSNQLWKAGVCWGHYFKAHPDEKRPVAKSKKTQVSSGSKLPITKAVTSEQGGKVSEPEKVKSPVRMIALPDPADFSFILTINFSKYPTLLNRLNEKANEEYRTPELQLLYHLNNTFADMEATIK